MYVSDIDQVCTPQPQAILHIIFLLYNHARRFRLEKLLCLESLLEAPTDFLRHFWIQVQVVVSEVKRPLHGGFGSGTDKNLTDIHLTDTPNGRKCPFGCNVHVTAVAVGQSQQLYS
jgi:hypothetical protein